jgi:hypothetical protein
MTVNLRIFYVVCRSCQWPMPLLGLGAHDSEPGHATCASVLGTGQWRCPACGRHHQYRVDDIRWYDWAAAHEGGTVAHA